MKIKTLWIICAVASLLTSVTVFAQHGATGGGLMTEVEMQTYLNRLDAFLSTPEGVLAFPEVAIHDHFQSPSVHEIATVTYPVAKPDVQFDQFGNSRTCVSYTSPQYYFVCNQNAFEDSPDQEPRDYELLLHELFVQAGIEKPLDQSIPSTYKVSSRILNHLFKDEAWGWIPGSLPEHPIAELGIWCTDQPSILSSEVTSSPEITLLFWKKDGGVRFLSLKAGKAVDLFLGSAPFPGDCDQATKASSLTLAAGFKYAPLHAVSSQGSTELWLATNENIVLRSASTEVDSGSELWTQVLGTIFLQNQGVLERHLVACQSFGSWPDSTLSTFVNPNENR